MFSLPDLPETFEKLQLRVLAWNDHFFGESYLAPVKVELPAGGYIDMVFTTDRSELGDVDAVWFHGPTIEDMPPRGERRVPWILMSMESDINYPAQASPIARLGFDLFMTYRLDADIPCIYPNWSQYGDFRQPAPQHPTPSQGAIVSYIASNPVAYRDDYVQALMQHMPVDSLGSCLNNRSIEDFVVGGWGDGAWASILDVLPRYKFYLALENSCTRDYVTERIFHALVCGTVPIYLGAENVREFMPDDDAVIVASEFESPAALAQYLQRLDREPEAYARHLAWKDRPFPENFQRLVDLGSIDPRQRLAIKLAHGCDRSCNCGGRQREPQF